ncbi:phytanoyl-CoA dioxygenase family protein [Paucibacter sp. R3-3]|uniref:Phytanoyl-CoA dioxygenase family protein n=1 Tax=Roseateles agri TaxID=3098619 RepID=A0ABU5DNA2_9BURK|nr:phytanoyl-CoA dioxygenase family protein [Paucibacter sp. R3-3]MDY0747609.1 phytanoyl-CoA dioxygenase family protein [Paucibacter sp. R3-3]
MLSEDEKNRYAEHGVLFPLRVLQAEEVTTVRQRYTQLEQALGGRPTPLELTQLHRAFQWAWDVAAHPAALDIAESLIGPDLAIWATSVFCKYPEDDAYVGWHQDSRYWAMSGDDVVSVWIALTPSTVENGAMQVMRGTHLGQLQHHQEGTSSKNVLSRAQEIRDLPACPDVVDVQLAPGECSIHHVRAIHGSQANSSPLQRIGFVTRYVPPWTRQPNPMEVGVLRGSIAAFSGQNLVARPADDDVSEEAIVRFRASVSQFLGRTRTAAAKSADNEGS